jgi:hypothetical protein
VTAEERIVRRLRRAADLAAELDKLEVEIRQKAPRKSLSLPGRSRGEKQAEHIASTAKLRVRIFMEYEGACAACRIPLGAVWEFHHVQGGGLRRSRQRPGSVLPLCMECHRRVHRGDLGTLAQIALAPSLDAEARREAEHRIDKLMESCRSKETP